MAENQFLDIEANSLVNEVLKVKNGGYRLVQICSTKTQEGYELLYSFAKEYDLLSFRINISEGTKIMSISRIFDSAFLYENEIHDLFGIDIELISLDYKGTLYRTEKKTPFK